MGISKRYKKRYKAGTLKMEEISFGQWLSRYRKSIGLTQREVAERVNCATITLRKIEADQRRPSLQVAERLAGVLNIPSDEHSAFFHFARGDRLSGPESEVSDFPWHLSDTSLLTSMSGYLPDANIRLVTLDGPSWINRTGINLVAAQGSTPIIHDGIFIIMAAPPEMQNQLAQSIIQSLGFGVIPGKSPLDQLNDRISGKAVFLMVDNEYHPSNIGFRWA